MNGLVSCAIVGAKYRPPAQGLLSVLPAGARLLVRREPDNPHDANALQVLVATAELEKLSEIQLLAAIEGFGFSTEEVLKHTEWHLGYIPRGEAEMLAASFDAAGKKEVSASLTFAMNGSPQVSFQVP